MKDIDGLALQHWLWCESLGWHNKTQLESLALVASEVGEAVNECRGPKPTPAFAEECADILLRTLDLMFDNNIKPSLAIEAKLAKNRAKGNFKGRLK